PFDFARDVGLLARRLSEFDSVRLLIVDPVTSAVGVDSHKNAEVRRSLQPLVDLAATHGCALLGITHFGKGTVGREPLERVTGSLAFAALPRVVLCTTAPGGNRGRRQVVRVKSNIGPDGGGFEFDLEHAQVGEAPDVAASVVQWGAAVSGSARQLLAQSE